MFTGIIQAIGKLASRSDRRLAVEAAPFEDLSLGESISINGTCLTLLPGFTCDRLEFDLSPETWSRTALGSLAVGATVNLERAMSLLGRLGGHFVQGHVDAKGTLLSRRAEGEFEVFRFQAPPEYDRYLIDKGSIAVDGVSLTVVEPNAGAFDVWLIPHTLEQTNLGTMRARAEVNLEFDVLAKYVEKLLKRV